MDSYNNILILYDSGLDYFISHFEKKGLQTKRSFKKLSLISRIFRRIFIFLNLSQGFWYGNWKKDLLTFRTIIIFARPDVDIVKFIRKTNNQARIIYWYWDPVFRIGLPKKSIFKNVEIWSFDPRDCIDYNFKFNTTFYFSDISLTKCTKEYDVFFIGNDKGRIEYLQQLKNKLTNLGFKGHYHIIPDKKQNEKKQYKPIPYSDYLNILSKTKVLIDVMPLGQSGLTIRTMESIFFNMKLITNDHSIINQDFYLPENIFIIGKDNEDMLVDFINSPYRELEDKIVKGYEVSNWLERFNI